MSDDPRIDDFDRCMCNRCFAARNAAILGNKMPQYSRWLVIMTFCPITCETESFVLVDKSDSQSHNHFVQIAQLQFPTRIIFGTGLTKAQAFRLGLPK